MLCQRANVVFVDIRIWNATDVQEEDNLTRQLDRH